MSISAVIKKPFLQTILPSTGALTSTSVLRLDAVHEVVSGNKWYKLKNYITDAITLNKKNILTFGGAYSNHIVAAAAVCNANGLQSIGIIRGEEPRLLSHTLQQANNFGMQLFFVSREDYASKKIPANVFHFYSDEETCIIPEGGYGLPGMMGAMDILGENESSGYTHIIAAVGTGTMLAGLTNAAPPHQKIIGIPVPKNNASLSDGVKYLLPPEKQKNFELLHQFHFGGYAKYNHALITFMNEWYKQTGIPTDFVYTAKLFYAVNELRNQNYFGGGANVLVIHSGGLQGNNSLPKGTLIF